MPLNELQPGLRELIDGCVTLTVEERHALETGGMLVCMPVADNGAAEELWRDRGLPASFEGHCDMCGTEFISGRGPLSPRRKSAWLAISRSMAQAALKGMKAWVYGYCITFADGGAPEYQMLGEAGTEEECNRIANLLPAVCYFGSRPVKSATFIWTKNYEKEETRNISSSPSSL